MAWLDHNSFPLTYEDRRVIDDSRFSIVRPYIKEWNLQIREVKTDDEGQYRCTINTNPVRSKVITLRVKGKIKVITLRVKGKANSNIVTLQVKALIRS